MIPQKFAKKQALRLAGMQGFPREFPEAIGELVKALESAPAEELAEKTVSTVLDSAMSDTRCPMPAELKAILHSLQDDFRPDPNCTKCDGNGAVYVELPGGETGTVKCSCWARRPEPEYGNLSGYEVPEGARQ